jgi:hypothetical protein
MDRIIKRVFDEHYGERLSGRPYLLKTQIQRQMRNFLRSYILPLIKEQAVKILHVEHKIGIVSDQFNLKGRLDCVQKRNDKIVIIDHKITANAQPLKINCDKLDLAARKTWSSAIGSLQIPFYLLLYCESTNTAITGANGLYMLLGKSALNRGAELPLFTERDDVTSIFALLQNVIFKLLQEIVDPVIPFFPAEDKKRLCPSCNFQYLCGTQWVKR